MINIKCCVSLQIHHLAINALLKSGQIKEIEGSGFHGFEQETDSDLYTSSEQYDFDEATSCEPAFRVLKQLVQRCLQDAITSGNVFADAILQHLYRWLCRFVYLMFMKTFVCYSVKFSLSIYFFNFSPQSKLHDPAIYRMLCKVNSQLHSI